MALELASTSVSNDSARTGHVLRTVGSAFWLTLRRMMFITMGINLFWMGLLFALGSTPLAIYSGFAIVVYGICYRLLLLRYNRLVLTIIWVEVITHVIFGTLLLGPESAAHFFLFLCIPGVLASSAQRREWLQVGAVIGLFFTLEGIAIIYGPLAPLSFEATKLIAWFNYLAVFAIFCALTANYRNLVARAERKLLDTAMTDSLTGVSNRTHFNRRAADETARARRAGQQIAILLADIDHFKKVNDEFGHELGDVALKHVAEVIRLSLRETDVLARWGGEEFLVMLPESSLREAKQTAERMLKSVEASPLSASNQSVLLTISIGVALVDLNAPINQSIVRADLALYKSKASGRNCATVDGGAPAEATVNRCAAASA
ncbi:MAG: GGDEF domain-containing protein [Burkholderiaceae bacterium]